MATIFEQACNNIAKESYNLHLYLKTYSFLHHSLVNRKSSRTRKSSTGKQMSTAEKRLVLPGKVDDVTTK